MPDLVALLVGALSSLCVFLVVALALQKNKFDGERDRYDRNASELMRRNAQLNENTNAMAAQWFREDQRIRTLTKEVASLRAAVIKIAKARQK